ncbi:rhomboid family intramembrane serine protease [Desulfogranum japonicum]|uniref:rhomboid family intramembrane serine protease n=1 Tax=Desulfogranum japonicum TaxID=231447 RepID=UPI00040B2E5A|nr:rhomboid family intramembrane serine protease [Desulfogranum japonicum]
MSCQKTTPAADILSQSASSTWVSIATGDSDELQTLSLVLSSVDVEHQILLSSGEIQVRPDDASRAIDHLTQYYQENINWPEPETPSFPHGTHFDPVTLPIMVLLCSFFLHTGEWTQHNPWFLQGAVSRTAIIEQGQWWRLVTALTLHADIVHLTGNVLIGGYLMHELSRFLGPGTTWSIAILTGAMANWINIALRTEQHLSVGFSTIVFSCIGLFVGIQLLRRGKFTTSLLIPLGAGVSLLALLGSGGERTDLGAHLFGLCAGIFSGLLIRGLHIEQQAESHKFQTVCFLCAVSLVALSWFCAFHYSGIPFQYWPY